MVKVMCNSKDTVKLSTLVQFQGELKKRSAKDIEALQESINNDGLLMPFAIWQAPDGNNILLDGHGRLAALTDMALKDVEILTQDFPAVFINVDTEEQARKSLLQITSSYGKINKEGAIKFCASIPEYHAPAINKYVHKKQSRRKTETQSNEVILRIRIPADKEKELRELFGQTHFITIL